MNSYIYKLKDFVRSILCYNDIFILLYIYTLELHVFHIYYSILLHVNIEYYKYIYNIISVNIYRSFWNSYTKVNSQCTKSQFIIQKISPYIYINLRILFVQFLCYNEYLYYGIATHSTSITRFYYKCKYRIQIHYKCKYLEFYYTKVNSQVNAIIRKRLYINSTIFDSILYYNSIFWNCIASNNT